MKLTWLRWVIIFGFSFSFISALAAQESPVAVIPAGESIKIGVAVDLSNRLAASGLDVAQAASLAMNEYNERGGVLGFQVEPFIEDDLCEPEAAEAVANKFAEEPTLVAVVGHACSGASIAASDIYQTARIPMVSASSTSGRFTAQGFDVVNRTAVNDSFQGVVAARYIQAVLRPKTVFILHNGTAYGQGLADVVKATLEELGGVEIIGYASLDPEAEDYADLIIPLVAQPPDLIYFGGYSTEAAFLVDEIRMEGLTGTFFSGDGIFNQDFLDFSGEASDGTYITAGEQMGDLVAYNDFVSRYEAAYGISPTQLGNYHAQAFDAANILLLAIESVAELDADGNLLIDREALIQAVRATADYEGLSGTISCNEVGDCGTPFITLYLAKDNEWVKMGIPPNMQVEP